MPTLQMTPLKPVVPADKYEFLSARLLTFYGDNILFPF
jgi:hypothetical protein